MAVFMVEPHAMAIARSPSSNDFEDRNNIDYRMLPRSSGDGMEHNGNHNEPSNSTLHSSPSHQSYTTISSNTTYGKTSHNEPSSSTLHSSPSQQSYKATSSNITHSKTSHRKHEYSIQSSTVTELSAGQNESSRTHNHTLEHYIGNDANIVSFHRKDSSDYTRKNTLKLHGDLLSSEEEIVTSIPSNSSKLLYHDVSYFEDDIFDLRKDILDEHEERTISNQEFVELQNTVKDLEERNAKLIEDKTKLCVQLGLQTEVNSELKKLVVAAVGEDLENNLEALLMRNAQSAVEIKHWKKLSEEYAEESDKLAIECDVWRTKFMASRMMSDELSSWKTTLYTKYKQTQSALQRILNEREELKTYLIKTKRLLHILEDSVNHGGVTSKQENLNEMHGVGQQSVLELASVINCLVQDLTTNMTGRIQNISVPLQASTEDLIDKQNVEPTPGEKLAIQVLTSDVELHTDEQPEDSTVMKRLGKQYIGNSYQSRLMTNSFRVTYDCCDRCKGAVQVV